MFQSNLCDYSNAYIVIAGIITVEGANNRDRMNRSLAFKNNAPFISCISKVNSVLIENTWDLDVMLLYNLLEYSKSYSKTGSLWNYYKDELTDERNDDNGLNKNVINSKSFKYKTSIIGNTYNVVERITNAQGNELITLHMMQIKVAKKKLKLMCY